GYPNPTVHLLANSLSDTQLKAQFIQAQEAAVGINVVIDSADAATLGAREKAGQYDIRIATNMTNTADPNGSLYANLATAGPANYGGYSNPRLDLILANGAKATSTKARSTLYHVAQQIIATDRPLIVFYNPVLYAAFSAKLTGIHLNANGPLIVENAQYR